MDKVECERCKDSILWQTMMICGDEFDWVIGILPKMSLDIIKIELDKLIDAYDFKIFSYGGILGLIKEIDEEIMCRREGIERVSWLKEKYERQQKAFQEQAKKDGYEGSNIIQDDSTGEQKDKEEKGEVGDDGGEWV